MARPDRPLAELPLLSPAERAAGFTMKPSSQAWVLSVPPYDWDWATGAYSFDGAGNVKSIGTHTFGYDKVNRLKSATLYLEPTSSATPVAQTFTYDAFGNLQSIAGSAGRNTPTSSSTNRLTGATYDAAGNLTSWNGNLYEYDPFNMMSRYKTPTDEWIYLYTADDERAWSYKIGGTESRWTLRGLGGQLLRQYLANGWVVENDSIYRGGLLLAAETPQGVRHHHLDHLGTPRLISDSLGQQKGYHLYYPYGEEATAFNQDTIRTKFTGHERDLANPTGVGDDLDYMHARNCSPLTGRFLRPDPINSGSPHQPQSWNKYSYVYGGPLKYLDTDGKKARVFVDGNRVRVQIPIRFVGKAATPERIAAFKEAVESKWSGQFGRFEVTTEVTKGRLLGNRVKLTDVEADEKHVSQVVASRFATIFTEKDPEVQPETDAHEAGHLMGLADKYDLETGMPFPGWEGNLMAQLPGVVWDLNIEELLTRMGLMNSTTDNPPEE